MYGSLAGADTFFALVDFAGLWAAYTDPQKMAALERATLDIDEQPYQGIKYITTQALQFPRIWYSQSDRLIWDQDVNTGVVEVPEDIEKATYFQALALLAKMTDERAAAMAAGVTSLSVGSTSESYDLSVAIFDPNTSLCKDALRLVRKYFLEYN